jgi:hypothetical protein
MMTPVIIPGPGEPTIDSWQPVRFARLVSELTERLGPGRRVLAVDGRSAGGKTTLARRLARTIPDAALLSTDDVAWYESMFGWSDLLVEGVLRPFREGSAVSFRPPAWDRKGRDGAIEVADDARVLIIEGVGASRAELTPWIDLAGWVQSDFVDAERRGIARDVASGVNGDVEETVAFWHEWQAEEQPFLLRDRPWDRADLIVAGSGAEAGGDITHVRWQHDHP